MRDCTLCAQHLPHAPRPVLRGSASARLLIVGQAPGRLVHQSGIPFNDPSGKRLREWMGVDPDTFYDESRIALLPMGFCYPGRGRGGDLPPRSECAATWRAPLLETLSNIQLTLVIGRYAQAWHLYPGERKPASVSDCVAHWRDWYPRQIPLPHPSPRNTRWLRDRPWFEQEVLPALRRRVSQVL